jgi:hypothetical protein
MNDTIITVSVLIYNFCLLAGAAALVQVYGWSMWTFLLAIIFFITHSQSD